MVIYIRFEICVYVRVITKWNSIFWRIFYIGRAGRPAPTGVGGQSGTANEIKIETTNTERMGNVLSSMDDIKDLMDSKYIM